MPDLIKNFNLESTDLAHFTSAIQFGFIFGTLIFAFFSITDRFSPSKVFFFSAIIGATFNSLICLEFNTFSTLILFRFLSGFFLAGIYPVGMKIAADYHQKGLGKALGFLVGALVLGTALPHFLKGNFSGILPWERILVATSILAVIGGTMILLFVPNGPYRKANSKLDLTSIFSIFKNKTFRSAAFGYFGHMWELYTFWFFLPIIISTYNLDHFSSNFNPSILSFYCIGIGALACVASGYLSRLYGEKKIATISLFLSGVCCLLSPFMFQIDSEYTFIAFLLFWGCVVIADSPLFSTMVANSAPTNLKGTALTIVNCVGFSLTIISLQFLNYLSTIVSLKYIYIYLAIGPFIGLFTLLKRNPKT